MKMDARYENAVGYQLVVAALVVAHSGDGDAVGLYKVLKPFEFNFYASKVTSYLSPSCIYYTLNFIYMRVRVCVCAILLSKSA